MGFFSKTEPKEPEWISLINENQVRFFVFIDKLELKMQELCEAAIPELEEMYKNDPDIFHREYGRMRNAVYGQLSSISDKIETVYEEKITDLYRQINDQYRIYATIPYYSNLSEFRNVCQKRKDIFDQKLNEWEDKINKTSFEDLEAKYQLILNEYAALKDKFKCSQCGSPIYIEKIFFISTYIVCPSCQTQNTFEPSTQAQMLQHFAGNLAEQRTNDLYQAYQAEKSKERDLYYKKHENRERLSDDKKTAIARKQQNDIWEQERQASIKNTPILYEKYIRAKYAEWIKITPDQEQHLLTRMENELREM